MSSVAPPPRPARVRHPNLVLAILILAGSSIALAQTLVAPALPAIQADMGTTASSAAWLLTAFLLTASIATPIVGKLGDVHGRGRVLAVMLLVFAAGSVVCGLAGSIGVLIAGRAIQGTALGLFPLAFGIIRDTFPRERVATAIGSMSATFGIGGGLGLVLSGVIVDNLDHAWLFWIGLGSLPAALATWRVVPPQAARADVRIDWAGAALLSLALLALLLGVSQANRWGWGSAAVLALLAAGVGLLVAWVALELRAAEPLVDIRLLRHRPVLMTNVTAVLIGFGMLASFLLIPQFVQTPSRDAGYGFTATVTEAGLYMVPSSLVMLVAGPVAGMLAGRFGGRLPLLVGAGAAIAAFGLLGTAHDAPWQFLLASALLGVGIGFAFSSMANLIVEHVPPGDVGVSTGINTIMRTIGGAVGASLSTAIITADTVEGTPLPVEAGYTAAFLVAAGGAALALLAALAIPGGRRRPAVPVADATLARP